MDWYTYRAILWTVGIGGALLVVGILVCCKLWRDQRQFDTGRGSRATRPATVVDISPDHSRPVLVHQHDASGDQRVDAVHRSKGDARRNVHGRQIIFESAYNDMVGPGKFLDRYGIINSEVLPHSEPTADMRQIHQTEDAGPGPPRRQDQAQEDTEYISFTTSV